jgi:WD40 repeat protein
MERYSADPKAAAHLVSSVARAVHYAHQRGILHRDLKPSNILLDSAGQPHVADFGLAKRLPASTGLTTGVESSRSTVAVGTPGYMAPEQLAGGRGAVTTATDVHGLGALLYALLAGKAPFQAENVAETLQRVTQAEPDRPSRWNARVDRDLDLICLKCLEKEPHRRYASADQVADELECYLQGHPLQRTRAIGSTERLWRWCRRNPIQASLATLAAVLAAALGIGVIVASFLRGERNAALSGLERAERAEAAAREAQDRANVLAHLARARAIRLSGQMGQRFKALEAVAAAAKLHPPEDLRGELRNEAIACLACVDLRLDKEVGSNPTEEYVLFDASFQRYGRRDGKGGVSIYRVGDDRELTLLSYPEMTCDLEGWSPDGKYVAIRATPSNTSSLKTQFFCLWDLNRDKKILELPIKVDKDVDPSNPLYVAPGAFTFGPESRQAAAGIGDGLIHFYELATAREMDRWAVSAFPSCLAFHPDGKKLALGSLDSSAIEVREVGTGKLLASKTYPAKGVRQVIWHPEGKLLAAIGDAPSFDIPVWNVETGQVKTLEGHFARLASAAFSYRGDLLASHSWDQTYRLWNPVTGRQLLSAQAESLGTQFSSDDRWLTCATDALATKLGFLEVAAAREFLTLAYQEQGSGPFGVAIDREGSILASCSKDGVRFWDLTHGKSLAWLPIGSTGTLLFQSKTEGFVTAGGAGVFWWPIVREPALKSDHLRIGPPESLASPGKKADTRHAWQRADEHMLAVVDNGTRRALLWDRPKNIWRELTPSIANLDRVALSPDGNWAVTAPHGGGSVDVWDLVTRKRVRQLWPVINTAMLAFSPDGRFLVTGLAEQARYLSSYVVWEVGTWQRVREVRCDTWGGWPSAAFSPDGKTLAVVQSLGKVLLLDAGDGRELAVLEAADPQMITEICFSPDGTLLAAACETRRIQLWNLRSIRRQLATINLDWDAPAYTSKECPSRSRPLTITVDLGVLAPKAALLEK